jgi:hypothetical protein
VLIGQRGPGTICSLGHRITSPAAVKALSGHKLGSAHEDRQRRAIVDVAGAIRYRPWRLGVRLA